MDKQDKIFLAIFAMTAIMGISYALYDSMPHTENIWVPQNASIANLINDNFVRISDVKISGTASEILNRNKYIENFYINHNAIYIKQTESESASVYYITKLGDKTYYYEQILPTDIGNYEFFVTKNSIKANFQRSNSKILIFSFLWIFVSIFISIFLTKIILEISKKLTRGEK